jgi:hypothetical protein
MGFKHTIPVFERAKTFHALDRAANVISSTEATYWEILMRSDNLQNTPDRLF